LSSGVAAKLSPAVSGRSVGIVASMRVQKYSAEFSTYPEERTVGRAKFSKRIARTFSKKVLGAVPVARQG